MAGIAGMDVSSVGSGPRSWEAGGGGYGSLHAASSQNTIVPGVCVNACMRILRQICVRIDTHTYHYHAYRRMHVYVCVYSGKCMCA